MMQALHGQRTSKQTHRQTDSWTERRTGSWTESVRGHEMSATSFVKTNFLTSSRRVASRRFASQRKCVPLPADTAPEPATPSMSHHWLLHFVWSPMQHTFEAAAPPHLAAPHTDVYHYFASTPKQLQKLFTASICNGSHAHLHAAAPRHTFAATARKLHSLTEWRMESRREKERL